MKCNLIIVVLFISTFGMAQSDKLEGQKLAIVNRVIDLFKQQNIEEISKMFHYPLERAYPIPSVLNENDFKMRFHEIFDKTIINKISHSQTEQWSEMGWRGIMLDNGTIWLNSDDGKIIGINYQSGFEKKLQKNLITKEKAGLHESLKIFVRPVYKIKTKNYVIRIDEIKNNQYRYASWKVNQNESAKPELILKNGVMQIEGSAGAEKITFTNGRYTYILYNPILLSENEAPFMLEVMLDGNLILKEEGTYL